jgi:type II secretory pathway pseudopilin PulG
MSNCVERQTPGKTRSGQMARRRHLRDKEGGWALLGLLLALAVIGIVLMSIAPDVRMQVQREKEEEMIYRGQQMAVAIARYYNFGNPGPITIHNVINPPPYGRLTELKKLKEIITIVGRGDIKFVRASALIDPLVSDEWEPVRVRDPRILPALNAIAAERMIDITPYLSIAAAPVKPIFASSQSDNQNQNANANANANQSRPPGGGSVRRDGDGNPIDPRNLPDGADPDADDDDDDDPLSSLLDSEKDAPGKSNLPIVGVAPRSKGPSVRKLYGSLQNYEEWVFFFVPDIPINRPNLTPPGFQNNNRRR